MEPKQARAPSGSSSGSGAKSRQCVSGEDSDLSGVDMLDPTGEPIEKPAPEKRTKKLQQMFGSIDDVPRIGLRTTFQKLMHPIMPGHPPVGLRLKKVSLMVTYEVVEDWQ